MPQSLLDKMNYNELESLATSRGIAITQSSNSEDLRKAIHDWEINKGLPFKGLREVATKNTETTDLEAHLSDLKETLGELLARVARIESILENQNNA